MERAERGRRRVVANARELHRAVLSDVQPQDAGRGVGGSLRKRQRRDLARVFDGETRGWDLDQADECATAAAAAQRDAPRAGEWQRAAGVCKDAVAAATEVEAESVNLSWYDETSAGGQSVLIEHDDQKMMRSAGSSMCAIG